MKPEAASIGEQSELAVHAEQEVPPLHIGFAISVEPLWPTFVPITLIAEVTQTRNIVKSYKYH